MSNPPAGYYPDPQSSAQERWWDGQAWTEHTRPTRPQPPAREARQVSGKSKPRGLKIAAGATLGLLLIAAAGITVKNQRSEKTPTPAPKVAQAPQLTSTPEQSRDSAQNQCALYITQITALAVGYADDQAEAGKKFEQQASPENIKQQLDQKTLGLCKKAIPALRKLLNPKTAKQAEKELREADQACEKDSAKCKTEEQAMLAAQIATLSNPAKSSETCQRASGKQRQTCTSMLENASQCYLKGQGCSQAMTATVKFVTQALSPSPGEQSASECDSWAGPNINVLVCDSKALEEKGGMGDTKGPKLTLTSPDGKSKGVSLLQAAGGPLGPGSKIKLQGKAPYTTELRVITQKQGTLTYKPLYLIDKQSSLTVTIPKSGPVKAVTNKGLPLKPLP